ncbi:YybH family protein [Rhodanobacter thiooxydans]|nr:nuclear transport factor 2 family protein [Rhodanobacter thiooxydans]
MTTRQWLIGLGMFLAVAGLGGTVPSHAASAGGEAAAIRQVMAQQAAAWNRGDVEGYMRGYKDAPDTTFIGSSVRKGYRGILDSYRQHYATAQQMGRLTFSELDVRLLPSAGGEPRYAVVTGRFHLDRATHGEVAQDDGVFSLLWEKTADGWKIILDHTS